MDKNDFDIDFDFDKEYGLDEDDLSGQAGDDTQAAGQDFDLSQFEDDGSTIRSRDTMPRGSTISAAMTRAATIPTTTTPSSLTRGTTTASPKSPRKS